MAEELISVIIPVYNAGENFTALMESILAQDCGPMQVILVDDGSTDGSGHICDAYAAEHPAGGRIEVECHHIPNLGPAAARNEGLAHARGRFIAFADADDLVPEGAYRKMKEALLEEMTIAQGQNRKAPAMVVGQYRIENIVDGSSRPGQVGAPGLYESGTVRQTIAYHDENYGGGYLWCRMIDRSRCRSLPEFDPELHMYEDKEWLIRLLYEMDTVRVIGTECYVYYVRSNSASWGSWHSPERILGWSRIMKALEAHDDLTTEIVTDYIYNFLGQFLRLTDYGEKVTAWGEFTGHLKRCGVYEEGANQNYVKVYTDLLWLIHKPYPIYYLQLWPTYRHMKVIGTLGLRRSIKCALLYAYKVRLRLKEKHEAGLSLRAQSRRAYKKYGRLQTPERTAALAALKQEHKKLSAKPAIAFVLQFPETWSGLVSLYQAAESDGCRTLILCVPKPYRNADTEFRRNPDGINAAYDYLTEHHTPAVRADLEEGWYDLKAFGPDYVFYTRPYNYQLPPEYQSSTVKDYARTCYIPYGYNVSGKKMLSSSLNYAFTSFVDIIFHSSTFSAANADERFPYQKKNGDHRYVTLGCPRFDSLKKAMTEYHRQEPHGEGLTITWLPRWLFADLPGQKKSHFLDYYGALKSYMAGHPEHRLILRPHPLMWESMVEAGVKTREEVDELRREIRETPNMILDEAADYMPSLFEADVLLADFTSLLAEFMVTGNPLIYTDEADDFHEGVMTLLEGFYCETEWERIREILDRLADGQDPKRELRQALWHEVVKEEAGTVGPSMIRYIEEDYEK